MRLCRFDDGDGPQAGFYFDERVVPLKAAADAYTRAGGESPVFPSDDSLLDFLPLGRYHGIVQGLYQWLEEHPDLPGFDISEIRLLMPNPCPNKLFLLAGNYAKHIEEGGGIAAKREETFPYVFMKPPTTTLTDPGAPVTIPKVSPDYIDWELELGVVIGKGGKHISEADALSHVAGYTVFNDISDRKFRPNPNRKEREKDKFFDWLHGKWHDNSCPCGPCITSANTITDPQTLGMKLAVNSEVFQEASTSQQIFPVAAVIEFISSFVTLEPGDMISTGTSAGVGNTTQSWLKPGDRIEASIEQIGTLISPVEAEA